MTQYSIKCSKVSKSYGYVWALRDIDLTIEERESVAVLGPNGAGKTTFLKILATQISPTDGRVWIFDKDLKREREFIKKSIGFLGHGSFLYDELTVKENLIFYGRMFLDSEHLDSIIDEFLRLLRLERFSSIETRKLSHGLRKRAELARALLHSPTLIILDEPFSGLDESSVDLLLEHLKTLQDRTIILSSHSAKLVKQVSSRTILLDGGRLVSDSKE